MSRKAFAIVICSFSLSLDGIASFGAGQGQTPPDEVPDERDSCRLPRGQFTPAQAKALSQFARRLDESADVDRAAREYAKTLAAMKSDSAGLIGEVSVEPHRRYTAGQIVAFDVHTSLRAPTDVRFECYWAAFERHWGRFDTPAADTRYSIVSAGGVKERGTSRLSVVVSGPSQKAGQYELLFVAFGRASGEPFAYLDSARIRYTVTSAPSSSSSNSAR